MRPRLPFSLSSVMVHQVPIIEDNGKVVNESFDIALYLERTYPDKPSLFGGPGGASCCCCVSLAVSPSDSVFSSGHKVAWQPLHLQGRQGLPHRAVCCFLDT